MTDNPELADELASIGMKLRSRQRAARRLEQRRNELVQQALAEGWTHSHLARISGLSRGRIQQLNKTTNSA